MKDIIEFLESQRRTTSNSVPEPYTNAELKFGRTISEQLSEIMDGVNPPNDDTGKCLAIVSRELLVMASKLAVMQVQMERDTHPDLAGWLLFASEVMQTEKDLFDMMIDPYKGETVAGHA